jgi:hypothetical protein
VHRTAWCTICELVALGFFLGYVGYKSPDSPRETPDSPVLQPCCHVDKRQRSYGAPDGPVPHIGRSGAPQKRKTTNQGILCRILCSYYSLSGAPPDSPVHRRTEGKNCLPNGVPTAPSCLGAIKGPLGAWSNTPSLH